LKARAAANASGLVSLADDSGLCVNGLNGEPGIYSARWAGADKNFAMAMQIIEQKLGDNPDRTAYFNCTLALVWPDGRNYVFEGRVDGVLTFPPRGGQGFGYDPVFVPDGYDLTFAEMQPAQKKEMSHRARAIAKFQNFLAQ
jgi:XTP/dITP diphosphohydrolase